MHYESYTIYDSDGRAIAQDVPLESAAKAVVEAAGWILNLSDDVVSLHDSAKPETRLFVCFGGDAEDRLRRSLPNVLAEACKHIGGRYVSSIDHGSMTAVDRAEFHTWQALEALREAYEDHIATSGYPRTQAAEEVTAIIEAVDAVRPLIKAAREQAIQAA